MFEQSLLEKSVRGGWKKSIAVFASTIFQCCLLGVLALVPMIFTDTLPVRSWVMPIEPPVQRGVPAPPDKPQQVRPINRVVTESADGRIRLPTTIPEHVAMITDEGPSVPSFTPPVGVPWGADHGLNVDALTPRPSTRPIEPTPQPVAPEPTKPTRVRVGTIEPAMIIDRPQPVYPHLARIAGIEGVVRFEAIISRTGHIENLRLISGHPLLFPAAQEAVLRWRYKPTFLNGDPVEVVTLIEVKFALSR